MGKPAPAAPTAIPAPLPVDPSPPIPAVDSRLASVTIDTAGSTDVRYTLTGNGLVGWTVRFIQAGFLRGTDTAVDVAGTCLLEIDLSNVADDDASAAKPQRIVSEDATEVVEVLRYPSSDELAQSFIGTRSGNPQLSVTEPSGFPGLVISFS